MSEFTSSTVLYHPTGARCTLTLPADPQAAFDAVNAYIEAGFLAGMPTPAEGEKLHVDFVVRCKFIGKNNEPKERLYFYDTSSQFTGSSMTVYLDKPETVAEFEKATGLTVESMPFMKGKVAPAYDSGEYFDNLAKRVDFTVTRKKVDDPKAPQGYHYELVGYVSSKVVQNAPISPATPSNTGNGKVTALPPNTAQKTPEQLEAEQVSIDNDMPVDFSRNPPPNEKHNKTQWEAWLKRQFTMYKKQRSS
jgi:hypothetical protein